MKSPFYLSAILLFLATCQSADTTASLPSEVEEMLDKAQQKWVPDRRVARLDINLVVKEDGKFLLSGETTLPAAKDSFLQQLRAIGYELVDSITLLPTTDLGDYTWGLTRHSVANLRSEKGHSQELATQLLLGTPIRVLKQAEEWFFVQCPDGYLAWLHGGEFVAMTEAELDHWRQSERLIYIAEQGHSYAQAAVSSTRVGDLVKGDILQYEGRAGVFTQVRYPDGRLAFVPTIELVSFTDWLANVSYGFTPTNTIARQQLGKPYLWGGTSPKGMDCSGFTKTVYFQQGLIIPRDASQQVTAGTPVQYDEQLRGLEPGDFLFFGRYREDGTQKVTHVGIYLGAGKFIHSGSDNGANRIESLLSDQPDFAAHRRESLLQARRLAPASNGVLALATHPWYN